MLLESGAKTTADAVDYLAWLLLRVPIATEARDRLVELLTKELGTDSIDRANVPSSRYLGMLFEREG